MADASALQFSETTDGAFCVEGSMVPSRRAVAAAGHQSRTSRKQPFPPGDDAQPDPAFSAHPTVDADSKPLLAEMVGVSNETR